MNLPIKWNNKNILPNWITTRRMRLVYQLSKAEVMKGTYFSFPIVAIACAMFDSYSCQEQKLWNFIWITVLIFRYLCQFLFVCLFICLFVCLCLVFGRWGTFGIILWRWLVTITTITSWSGKLTFTQRITFSSIIENWHWFLFPAIKIL